MPTLDSVIEFRKKMFEESSDLIRKKGHDYNRKQQLEGDTLYNLRIASLMGIVETPEQGILVRLMDKMMRLSSLMTADVEAQVKEESVRDTVKDVHNYVDYALQLWEERLAIAKSRAQFEPRPQIGNQLEVKYAGAVIPAPISFEKAVDEAGRPQGFVVATEDRMRIKP